MDANSLPSDENRLNFLGMDAAALSQSDPNTFNGKVDNFRRFNKVLSDDEMLLVFVQDSQTMRYSFDDDLSDSTSNQADAALDTPGGKVAYIDGTLESVASLTAADPPESGPYPGITVAGWMRWSGPADQTSSPQPLVTCWNQNGLHLFTAYADADKNIGVEGSDGSRAQIRVDWNKGTLVGATSFVEEWNWMYFTFGGTDVTVGLGSELRGSTLLESTVRSDQQPHPNRAAAQTILVPALASTSMTCKAGQWNCALHPQNCATHAAVKEVGVWGIVMSYRQLIAFYEGGPAFQTTRMIASLVNTTMTRPAEITDDASNCKVGRCLYVPNLKHLERPEEDQYRSGYNEGVKVRCTIHILALRADLLCPYLASPPLLNTKH